jgi:hypothetical protein
MQYSSHSFNFRDVSLERSLGNVKFIGELYNFQLLTPKNIVEWIKMLLSTEDEESLECGSKLLTLTTVGQKLDEQLRESEAHVKPLMEEKKRVEWVWGTRAPFHGQYNYDGPRSQRQRMQSHVVQTSFSLPRKPWEYFYGRVGSNSLDYRFLIK